MLSDCPALLLLSLGSAFHTGSLLEEMKIKSCLKLSGALTPVRTECHLFLLWPQESLEDL